MVFSLRKPRWQKEQNLASKTFSCSARINPFTAVTSLETDRQKCDIGNLKPFSLLFFALACVGIFIKTHSIEVEVS